MKQITDTYCTEGGKVRRVGAALHIHSENAVVRTLLQKLTDEKSEGTIRDIYFEMITDALTEEIHGLFPNADLQTEDAYVIRTEETHITIYGNSERARMYGAGALYRRYDGGAEEGLVCNIPLCPVRGIKLYIPARDKIAYFKEFADMCMCYGYNTFYIEVGGAMEYKKHPEINEGWVEYCKIFEDYSGKAKDVQNATPYNKNSIHCENGGGSYLTQDEIKDLVVYCEARGIEVVPEVPCLSHSDYLLTRHPELAERRDDPLPDAYCPSNPKSYELLFDVLDEVIDVFRPRMIHIAHDEWYAFPLCEKCAGENPADLFARDVRKIYDYLKRRGVKTMMWGDMLLNGDDNGEPCIGGGIRVRRVKSDKTVEVKGEKYAVYDEYWRQWVDRSEGGAVCYNPGTWECIAELPKDIEIMNWSHRFHVGGKFSDYELHQHGFRNIYGNFDTAMMHFKNWFGRIADGVSGFSISNWSVADEQHMQRNAIFLAMAYGAMMLWNRDYDETKTTENVLAAAHELFEFHYKEAKKKSYIEIIHTTSEIMEHPVFVDGYFIDDKAYYMGDYEITRADGTAERHGVYWGRHIGPDSGFAAQGGVMTDGTTAGTTYTREPTYTCDYVTEGGRLFYKWLIPTDGTAKTVTARFLPQYEDTITVKSIRIINQ